MKKQILTPKSVQKIQDDIYYNMPFEKKWELFSKINSRVLKIAIEETHSRYAGLSRLSLVRKFHENFNLNRDYYDSLFNRLFEKELKSQK